jgi:hypothetical protein
MSRSAAADIDGDQEMGFHPRMFCQPALPYREQPADLPAWGRRNGSMSLLVQPGMTIDDHGRPASIGYPFGTILPSTVKLSSGVLREGHRAPGADQIRRAAHATEVADAPRHLRMGSRTA